MDLMTAAKLALTQYSQPYKVSVPGLELERIQRGETEVYPATRTEAPFPLQGRINFHGLMIDVENLAGSIRQGMGKDGEPWTCVMHAHYGEFEAARGADGDKLDVYVGPHGDSDLVVVVHQSDPSTGAFDEDKVMVGFLSETDALTCYLTQYNRPGFYGGHDVMDIAALKARFALRNAGALDEGDPLVKAATVFVGEEINDSAEARIMDGLARLLGQYMVDRDKAYVAHWNVTGPDFPQLHELFKGEYEGLAALLDEVAERIVQKGGTAVTSCSREPFAGESGNTYAAELAMARQRLLGECERLLPFAEARNDVPTVDLLTRHAAAHAKAAWMLRSTAGLVLRKGAGVDTPAEEKRWKKAKKIVKDEYGDTDGKWALVQHIYDNMTKGTGLGFIRSIGDNMPGNGSIGEFAYSDWIEVDEETALGMLALYGLQKGAGHKHFKKVPTGKFRVKKDGSQGAQIYRYFYRSTAGKGMGHRDELVVGSSHRGTHGGQKGHWDVKHDHGDNTITVRHDESGHEERLSKDEFAKRLQDEHSSEAKAASEAKKERAKKELEEAKAVGSAKHVEAAKKRAKAAGVEVDEPKVEAPKSEPKGSGKTQYSKLEFVDSTLAPGSFHKRRDGSLWVAVDGKTRNVSKQDRENSEDMGDFRLANARSVSTVTVRPATPDETIRYAEWEAQDNAHRETQRFGDGSGWSKVPNNDDNWMPPAGAERIPDPNVRGAAFFVDHQAGKVYRSKPVGYDDDRRIVTEIGLTPEVESKLTAIKEKRPAPTKPMATLTEEDKAKAPKPSPTPQKTSSQIKPSTSPSSGSNAYGLRTTSLGGGKVGIIGNTFAHKDALKAKGARWDGGAKAWYFPSQDAANKAISTLYKGTIVDALMALYG